jgi:hypothetical protein
MLFLIYDIFFGMTNKYTVAHSVICDKHLPLTMKKKYFH